MNDNKLIAEFMGWTEVPHFMTCSADEVLYTNPTGDDYTTTEMQFATNWDWLMPVVAKIQNEIDSTFCPSADRVLTYGMAVAKIRREIALQQRRSK
tara:strand:+ start:3721 stop:4008 length:288 start_codon:yes stop_codon:yes gene_type:complete